MEAFDSARFLPERVISLITDVRVNDPDRVLRAEKRRKRRARLAPSGRLSILAADHPGRRVTRVGEDTLAMANRHDYLARAVRVLLSSGVDGVVATMDLLEELLILDDLLREAGAPSFLEAKLLIASLNRAGLAGARWELDDPVSGPTPAQCAERGLDGGKFLLRLCDGDADSLKTLLQAAQVIREMNARHLPTFLEVLSVTRSDVGFCVLREAAALADVVGVASALGDSSRYLWLKLPYCNGFETVARATTLPVLLLGGEATGEPATLLTEVAAGLHSGDNVRGVMAGRNILYPGLDDPLGVAEAIAHLVHAGGTRGQAEALIAERRGRQMEAVTRWLVA